MIRYNQYVPVKVQHLKAGITVMDAHGVIAEVKSVRVDEEAGTVYVEWSNPNFGLRENLFIDDNTRVDVLLEDANRRNLPFAGRPAYRA